MRLINTKTGKFEEFFNSKTIPFYAILSHTWGPGSEQTYQEVIKIQKRYELLPSSTDDEDSSNLPPNTLGTTLQPDVLNKSKSPTLSYTALATQAAVETGPFPSFSLPGQTEPPIEVESAPPSPTPSIWDSDSELSEKVRKACEVARRDGYRYIWVDSSCINKASSTELDEAINSMFNWYRDAQICYAFLADVPSDQDVREPHSKFRESRWFKRSWTLQELIAPRMVIFLSQDWKGLGTKHSLASPIESITHIDRLILIHEKDFIDETVVKRMRWASRREATRVEDEAYSLLGIFGITMPTLYGEGRNAFRRLQEEILQRIPDRSLFAWGVCRPTDLQKQSSEYIEYGDVGSPFAESPRWFFTSSQNPKEEDPIRKLSKEDFNSLQPEDPAEEYTLTPHGIRAKLRFVPIESLGLGLRITRKLDPKSPSGHDVDPKSWYLLVLSSTKQDGPAGDGRLKLVGKLCTIADASSGVKLLNVLLQRSGFESENEKANGGAIFTALLEDTDIRTRCLMRPITVHLPYPRISSVAHLDSMAGDNGGIPQAVTVIFSSWAQGALPPGYTISDLHPIGDRQLQDAKKPSFPSLRLSNNKKSVDLLIKYRHMHIESGDSQKMGEFAVIEARIWIFYPDSSLEGSPPYTSAIWAVDPRQSTLPPRDRHVVTHSERDITLRLWLGIAKHGHYHAHIEIKTHGPHPTHPLSTRDEIFSEDQCLPIITKKHDIGKLKFTMLESVTRALQKKGYSADLEKPRRAAGNLSHSFSLTISNHESNHQITIKYFYILEKRHASQRLVVVARIDFESSSDLSDGSERYQDGPYVWRSAALCRDGEGWNWQHRGTNIYITLPTGSLLALTLGLDLAWCSEYYLVVDINPYSESWNEPWKLDEHDASSYVIYPLSTPHDPTIILKLPEHNKRALQANGYKVHFGGPSDSEDHTNSYHLTLTDINFIISIKYSYELYTDSDGRQRLTFRACVTPSRLKSSQDTAPLPGSKMVDWNALHLGDDGKGSHWIWTLPQENIKLELLANGRELTLHLGLYLVWFSEYCIKVEVIPGPAQEVHSPSRKERLAKFLDLLTPAFIQNRRKHAGAPSQRGKDSHEV